jgi:BMFP domain-containing protein YqiC
MTERPKFFDDLAGVAGGALSAFSGLRDEMTALIRARVDETIRMLDLVRRDDFDAIADVAATARSEVAHLTDRIAALEAQVVPAPPREIELPGTDSSHDGGAPT